MTYLRRPIADRIYKPLGAGLAWAAAISLVAIIIGLLVAGVGWVVTWIASWIGDASTGVPTDLVRAVLAALVPFIIGASAWAAAYASSTEATVRRALMATAAGVIVAIGAITWFREAAALIAFGATWSLAIPFQRWSRAAYRIAPSVVIGLLAVAVIAELTGLQLLGAAIAGTIVAAGTTWAGDEVWRTVQRRLSGGDDDENDKGRQ